ncbi:MAG: hypothetical protein SNJ64_01705, partial [Endomicrobiia bacterium]
MKFVYLILLLNITIFNTIFANSPESNINTKSTKEEQKLKEQELKQQWEQKDKEIKNFFISGEYIIEQSVEKVANISEVSQKINFAEQKAISKLKNMLKSNIKNTILDILKISGSSVEIENIQLEYLNLLLGDIKTKTYLDYPKSNNVTVLVYIEKSNYNSKVSKSITDRKNVVLTLIKEALFAEEQKNISLSLMQYIESRKQLEKLFPNISITEQLPPSSKTVELRSFVNSRIRDIISNLQIRVGEGKYYFNSRGEVIRRPQ